MEKSLRAGKSEPESPIFDDFLPTKLKEAAKVTQLEYDLTEYTEVGVSSTSAHKHSGDVSRI